MSAISLVLNPFMDRVRRCRNGPRLGNRGRHHGDHHHRDSLGKGGYQYRLLRALAVRAQSGVARRIFRARHRHRPIRRDWQRHLAGSCRLVAGALTPDHGSTTCGHDYRYPLRMGASKTCRDRALADRQRDRGRRGYAAVPYAPSSVSGRFRTPQPTDQH
jgi:hypothetical protein